VRPSKESRARKAKIQKIAAVCLGGLFVVLFVKTIVIKDKVPAPPRQAAARVRDTAAPEVRPAADNVEWTPQNSPVVRRVPTEADTLGVIVPPNPFEVSVRLRNELTGVKPKAKVSKPSPVRKKRIEVKLKGIVADHSSGERLALIDNQLLRTGDSYKGLTVVEIGPQSITVLDGEERRTITLEEKQ